MNTIKNITLLDCTFRDGGYYTNWYFDDAAVADYLKAMEQAGIDVIEIGFRFASKKGDRGPFAYSTDRFIEKLNIPESMEVAVMLNASDLISDDESVAEIIAGLFPEPAATSPVDWVRIAFHFEEVDAAGEAVSLLKSMGYKLGANLMQISEASSEAIEAATASLAAHGPDALYFADSLGTLKPADVTAIMAAMRTRWDGPIGIHAHDNMGLALQNSIQALSNGASYIDATVTGMGRGAGNVRLEELLIELNALNGESVNHSRLLNTIQAHFEPLRQEHGWGSNIFYFMAAVYKIHPTFIQELLSRGIFSFDEIYRIVNFLRQQNSRRYDLAVLESASSIGPIPDGKRWQPETIGTRDKILIIGNGSSVKEHRDAIIDRIRASGAFTIALNSMDTIPEELIDLRVASHPLRLIADMEKYSQFQSPLVLPYSILTSDQRATLDEDRTRFCDFQIKQNTLGWHAGEAVLPSNNVFAYALALSTALQAEMIQLVGFDGFAPKDPRQTEMEAIITSFDAAFPETAMVSLTPSLYNLTHWSLYAPE